MRGLGGEPDWEKIIRTQRLGDAQVQGWEQTMDAPQIYNLAQGGAQMPGTYTLTSSSASPSISYTASSLVGGLNK